MKLVDVWNAVHAPVVNEKPVWGTLTALKKPPRMAYHLLTYGAKLGAKFDVIEKYRVQLLYEVSGAPEGGPVDIKVGTPEFAQFVNKFNEFLSGDSDLEPVGIGMGALIDALDAEKGNVLSEDDLAVLEPFFQEVK